MPRRFYLLTILVLLLQPALAFVTGASAQEVGKGPQSPSDLILYVKPAATGSGDCSSWANACGLQAALAAAISGDEIWVQMGTYKPTTGVDRTVFFALKSGVEIYGGFAGTETSSPQRDWAANVTILSGDIGVAGNHSDNSYNVVVANGVDNTAVLDGFRISGGNANGNPSPRDAGGGMHNEMSSPTLANLIFSGNEADLHGGGMYNDDSSPTLASVTFSGNQAGFNGGGMYNETSNPVLANVIFSANEAYNGGGMYNESSSPTLETVTFNGNQASFGGGMYNSNSNPTQVNLTFSGNEVSFFGGGVYNYFSNSPTLVNVTFSGNEASSGGGMFNYYSTSPTLANAILWGNTPDQIFNDHSAPVITYSDLQNGCPAGATCTQVLTSNPLFVRSPSPGGDGNWGTSDDDYGDLRLQLTSPAIDAGNNAAVPTGVLTDLLGLPRFIDIASVADSGNGVAPIVDIGAYETQFTQYLPVVKK